MYNKYFKRFIDICICILFAPFICLLCIIIGLLILLFDGKPIIYRSNRIGLNGEFFTMYKFRTMKNNSPDIRLEDGSTFNGENDLRVTKLGKILRKTSIDEIPQMVNVLKGDMSFIGPRPDTPKSLHKYPEEEQFFLKVKPGITGYNQAYFRNSVDGKQKAINDMFYSKNISFWFDIKIFIKTIKTVILRQNTYK